MNDRFTTYRNRKAKVPSPNAIRRVRARLTASQRRIVDTLFDAEGNQKMHLADVARTCGVTPQYVRQVICNVALLVVTLPDDDAARDDVARDDEHGV